jgi:hypothetical protein
MTKTLSESATYNLLAKGKAGRSDVAESAGVTIGKDLILKID